MSETTQPQDDLGSAILDKHRRAQATTVQAAWTQRQDTLRRLAEQVTEIRGAAEVVRVELRELLQLAQTRRLDARERDRVRHLNWESERLRWELSLLREQFEQVRALPKERSGLHARSDHEHPALSRRMGAQARSR